MVTRTRLVGKRMDVAKRGHPVRGDTSRPHPRARASDLPSRPRNFSLLNASVELDHERIDSRSVAEITPRIVGEVFRANRRSGRLLPEPLDQGEMAKPRVC